MMVLAFEPGTRRGAAGALTSNTERKLPEGGWEEAQMNFHDVANRVPGVVFQFRLYPGGSSCMPFASEGIRELFRVSPDEVSEDVSKLFSRHHPDDHGGFVASIRLY